MPGTAGSTIQEPDAEEKRDLMDELGKESRSRYENRALFARLAAVAALSWAWGCAESPPSSPYPGPEPTESEIASGRPSSALPEATEAGSAMPYLSEAEAHPSPLSQAPPLSQAKADPSPEIANPMAGNAKAVERPGTAEGVKPAAEVGLQENPLAHAGAIVQGRTRFPDTQEGAVMPDWAYEVNDGSLDAILESAELQGWSIPNQSAEPVDGKLQMAQDEEPGGFLGCNAPICSPLNHTFSCLTLYTPALTPANPNNVAMNSAYVNDYYMRVWANQTPHSNFLYTKLGPPGETNPLVLATDVWCCGVGCGNCNSCSLTTLSTCISCTWPSNGQFTIPTVTPGWQQLSIGIYTNDSVMDAVMVNLTYPNAVDLALTQFTVNGGQMIAGQQVTGNVVVRNFGENASGGSTVFKVYMSDDPVVTTSDTLVGSTPVGSIPGGYHQTSPLAIQFTPPATASGTKYFAVVPSGYTDFDPTNNWSDQQSESFLADIRFAGAQLTWNSPPPEPNGVAKVVPGDQIGLRFQYENVGNAATSSNTTHVVMQAPDATSVGTELDELVLTQPMVPPMSGVITSPDHNLNLTQSQQTLVGSRTWIYVRFEDVGSESNASNNSSDRQEVLCSAEIDLVLHLPGSIDVTQLELPDGAHCPTWKNLDNDDNDYFFDFDPNGITDLDVTGGDDELVRMELRVRPKEIGQHTFGNEVILRGLTGDNYVKVWADDTKAGGEFTPLNMPLSLYDLTWSFMEEGDWLVLPLWVEGIDGPPLGSYDTVNFELEYLDDLMIGSPDLEKVQVLEIEELKTTPFGNGYGPDYHESYVGDPDPALDIAGIPSIRVFSGTRASDYPAEAARDRVRIQVVLNQVPLRNVEIHLRSFDVDDLSQDTFIDPNDTLPSFGFPLSYFALKSQLHWTPEEDNRNEWQMNSPSLDKAGRLWDHTQQVQQDPQTKVLTLTATTTFSSPWAFLEVSKMAGDSYRVAASCDKDLLADVSNLDHRDDQKLTVESIWERPLPLITTSEEAEIPLESQYASKVVVVWRILHLETDSMVPMTNQENRTYALAGRIVGPGTATTFIEDIDENLDDGSRNLDDVPSGKGRFDYGEFPSARVRAGGTTEAWVDANGDDRVQLLGSTGDNIVPIQSRLTLPGTPPTEFIVSVDEIVGLPNGTDWELTLGNLPVGFPTDWSLLVDSATLILGGGHSVNVIAENQGASTVTVDQLSFPILLWDDDDRTAFTSTNKTPFEVDTLNTGLEPAHMLAVIDGGLTLAHNQTEIGFLEYSNSTELDAHTFFNYDSATIDSPDFWMLYVGSAFQINKVQDNDPPRDPNIPTDPKTVIGQASARVYHHAPPTIGMGGPASYMFQEVLSDSNQRHIPFWHPDAQDTLAHEVGHQLGLSHTDENGVILTNTIMHPAGPHSTQFSSFQVHLLRSLRETQ